MCVSDKVDQTTSYIMPPMPPIPPMSGIGGQQPSFGLFGNHRFGRQ